MVPTTPDGAGLSAVDGRRRLVFSLQQAYNTRRFGSSSLRVAVGEFARNARHRGLDRNWVLDAVQDAIDASLFPILSEAQRHAFSEPVQRMVEEAYNHCHERIAPRTFIELAGTPGEGLSTETRR